MSSNEKAGRRRPDERSGTNALTLALRGLGVALAAMGLTLIIPGIVAATGGVFYSSMMVDNLPATQRETLRRFNEEQRRVTSVVMGVDKAILEAVHRQPFKQGSVQELAIARRELMQDLRTRRPPITLVGFFNPQMLLWPSLYVSLLWLATIFRPDTKASVSALILKPRTWGLALVIYGAFEWPLWLRNFLLGPEVRVVYAYANVDVHPASFVTQEFIVFGFALLLAVIWQQWAIYLRRVREDDSDELTMLTDSVMALSFSDIFTRWFWCSIVLGMGFGGLTGFYWNLVARLNDPRYLLSAVLAHLLWGVTWVVLTLPLLNEWRLWESCKMRIYQALALAPSPQRALERADLIERIQPISWSVLAVVRVGSVISFFLPIIQAFVR